MTILFSETRGQGPIRRAYRWAARGQARSLEGELTISGNLKKEKSPGTEDWKLYLQKRGGKVAARGGEGGGVVEGGPIQKGSKKIDLKKTRIAL